MCGIARPPNCPARKAVYAFNPPADKNIAFTALARRSCPHVVPRSGAATTVVFQDVQIDAVPVRKARARIGTRTRQYPVRRAEPVAEGIEVVDPHDKGGQRMQALAPG